MAEATIKMELDKKQATSIMAHVLEEAAKSMRESVKEAPDTPKTGEDLLRGLDLGWYRICGVLYEVKMDDDDKNFYPFGRTCAYSWIDANDGEFMDGEDMEALIGKEPASLTESDIESVEAPVGTAMFDEMAIGTVFVVNDVVCLVSLDRGSKSVIPANNSYLYMKKDDDVWEDADDLSKALRVAVEDLTPADIEFIHTP